MTYNEKFFSAEDNEHYRNRLNKLMFAQKLILQFLIKNLLAANDQAQIAHCECFLHLLAKIRINLESVNTLIEAHLYDDYRFKASINLLYRSVIDDLINISYLVCLVEFNDPNQQALSNELDVLHKEYLISSIDGLKSQFEFQKLINSYNDEPEPIVPDFVNEFKNSNPTLVDVDQQWKRNKDIRHNTNSYFIGLMNQTDNRRESFISEKKKLEFVQARGFQQYSQLNGLFKYYSQFQHFSPKSISLLNSHIDYDITSYYHVIGELTLTINRLYDVLNFEGKDTLVKEWEKVADIVFSNSSK